MKKEARWAMTVLVLVLSGCGGGSHDNAPALSRSQTWVVAGDFNGDGRLDLAVSRTFFSGTKTFAGDVQVFLQDPTRPPGTFPAAQSYEVGGEPSQVASADLNGDGVPDLVTANAASDTVSVLLGRPGSPGQFFPAVDYPCGAQPLSVAVGDLNRDGIPDLAVAVADGVDILLQSPNARGQFSLLSPPELALGGGAFAVAVGDLDGDSIPDIVASGTSEIDVFYQSTAAGTFTAAVPFAAGVAPNGVAVADINLDGFNDIVVANAGATDGTNSSFSVLLQDPGTLRNFLAARNFAAPNGTQNVAVGDLDGDGLPDIVLASTVLNSQNAGVVSVFLQSGDPAQLGTFGFSASYPDGFSPLSVAIGDFNGDLRPDIAIQDGPSILFQTTPAGTFLPEVLVGP